MEAVSLVLLVGITLVAGVCIFFIVYSIAKGLLRRAEARKRKAEMLRQQELERIRLAEEARLRALEEQRRLEEFRRTPIGKAAGLAKGTAKVVKDVAGGTADVAKGAAGGVTGVAGGIFTVAKVVVNVGLALGGVKSQNGGTVHVKSHYRKDGTFVREHTRRKG